MYRVQRLGGGDKAEWKTLQTLQGEAEGREAFRKQLRVNSTGRFRLLGPGDKVLAEEKALPLFARTERDDEERPSTLYTPAPPRPG